MVYAHLLNRGGPRTAWAMLTGPADPLANFGTECTFDAGRGRTFRAVRDRTRGGNVTTFRVHASMGEAEQLDGRLFDRAHPTATPFLPHPWVADNIPALLTSFGVQRNGSLQLADAPTVVRLDGSSNAHQRWHVRCGIPSLGMWMYSWLDLHHMDPVGRWYSTLAWSNRRDPEHRLDLDGVMILSGEPLALDFAMREGFAPAFHSEKYGWSNLISGPITLGEGEGWMMSGQLLCTPDGQFKDADERDMESLLAAEQSGRILSACAAVTWDNQWTAAGGTPIATGSDLDQERQRFLDLMRTSAGYGARRTLGLQEAPNMTGDQRDFGTAGGTHVLVGHLDMMDAYKHAAQAEAMRGVLHYEADGRPLDRTEHPDWVTWEGRTHWSRSVSPDRLGKRQVPWPIIGPDGWKGYDRQHRSQNALAADLWLDDDPAVQHYLDQMLTTDMADVRNQYNQREGARGEGRTAGTFADFAMITGNDGWYDLIDGIVIRQAVNPTMSRELSMPVLAVIPPDGRKPIYLDGELMRTTSIWEHGLAALGFAKCKQLLPDDEELDFVFQQTLTLLARWGCFLEDGEWYVVDDIGYFDGAPIPGDLNRDNPYVLDPRQGNGVTLWSLFGVAVAARWLRDEPLRQKAQHCTDALLGRYLGSVRTAEWLAVLNRDD